MVKLIKNTDDGARIYTPLTLKLYDWWVLGVSNRLAWGCPTKEHLLPHFLEHLGNNHLDIGVGTGFYLTHVPESSLISLMDLNEASLNAASTRAGESKLNIKLAMMFLNLIPRRYMVNLIPFPCLTFFTACLEIYLQKLCNTQCGAGLN